MWRWWSEKKPNLLAGQNLNLPQYDRLPRPTGDLIGCLIRRSTLRSDFLETWNMFQYFPTVDKNKENRVFQCLGF